MPVPPSYDEVPPSLLLSPSLSVCLSVEAEISALRFTTESKHHPGEGRQTEGLREKSATLTEFQSETILRFRMIIRLGDDHQAR